jgi:hypothetical protein
MDIGDKGALVVRLLMACMRTSHGIRTIFIIILIKGNLQQFALLLPCILSDTEQWRVGY